MRDLQTEAERVKLARVLGVAPEALAFLARRDAVELRLLGERVSHALFDEYRAAFQRLADASRLLPASLVAKLSERVFGPMLSARVAGLMAPDRALEVATRLRMDFLADVCVELDPRSAVVLLQRIEPDFVVQVARRLLARGDHVTLGRFVDALPDRSIRAVVDDTSDDAALLRVASYVERRERVAELVGMLPPSRLEKLVDAVVRGERETQAAGLAMLAQLDPPQQARFAAIAARRGPEVLAALRTAAEREGLAGALAGLVPAP